MKSYVGEQIIDQLEKRKGGYYFIRIEAEIVEQFEAKKATRFICRFDDKVDLRCGLNHLGDGNFYIIISKKNFRQIGRQLGDTVKFHLSEDPDPMGVEVPEAFEVLLEQDELLKERFDQLTIGKRRSIIHQINRIKNIDRQISKSIELIEMLSKVPGRATSNS